jgi:hypothetical protein
MSSKPLIRLLAASFSLGIAVQGVRAAEPPAVKGLLATAVHFDAATSDTVAAAMINLLAHCTLGEASTEADWHAASQACHLRATFANPRAVAIDAVAVPPTREREVDVAEIILTLPLTSGRVWIKSGNQYYWFAKWPGVQHSQLCNPIQQLLKGAVAD